MKITIFGYKSSTINLFFLIGLFYVSINVYYCEIPKDIIALEVINDLHIELDDNQDGVVDADEAGGFAQENLKYDPSSEMTNIFTHRITKDNLWSSWKSSEAYNWTVDDVIIWLTVHIDLPEYTNIFVMYNITGSMIPRLASSNSLYLQNDLKIINQEHCKKIALNSKELILFGIPKDIESKFSKDKLAFEAIKQLHAQLDDDQDGGVDPQEADEFARDELRYTTDFERAKGFNKNDNHISQEELWRNWKSSKVFNWTVPDVLEWLCTYVELPEYVDIFRFNEINGSVLPRLSLSDMSFLIKDLKIKNTVHRKKLLLKSTDLILFGAPKKHHSKMKDSILFTLTLLTIGGCWMAFLQHRHSKKQLKNMQDKMNQLGKAEESLCKLQNKLKEAEIQNSRVTSEKLEIEEKLKSEIEKFKEEITRTDSNEDFFKNKQSEDQLFNQLNLDQGFSQNLKILLQMTYEVEGHFFLIKRLAAEQQMKNVRDMCERLRKKKNTFIGSLKMAHSGNLDDMDKQLSEAKHSIDEVRSDLNERSQRWECIEKLTRFKIFPTPGLAALRSTFKTNNSGGIIYRKHSVPTPVSDLCSLMSTNNAVIPVESAGFMNYDAASSNTRPRNLKFYMNGGCSGDFTDRFDTMSNLEVVDTISDVIDNNLPTKILPKSSSVSNSLFYLRTSPSQCSSLFDHNSSFSIGNGKLNHHPVAEVETGSRQNVNVHMSQVRPFAFRWLKRLDKSKLPFKKSKHI